MAFKVHNFKKHRGAFLVSAVSNCTALLFGFDVGIMGAILALESFRADFELESSASSKYIALSSNLVSILTAGCFFGNLVPALCGNLIGRRHLLLLSSCVLLIGGIIQTIVQPPNTSWLYGGRVMSGFSMGMSGNTVPNYVAECSPKQYRGLLVGLYEMFFVTGGTLAFFITYGASVHLAPTSRQWRIPLSLQVPIALLILLGTCIIIESPRWLAKKGRWEEAETSLCYLRGGSPHDEDIVIEMADIKAQLERERAATKGLEITEMLHRKNLLRLACGVGTTFFNVWCGQNGIINYAPTVFRQIGYSSQNAALLASGVSSTIKVVCNAIFLVAIVEIFKRTHLLATGALLMGVLLFALGAILKLHPPADGAAGSPSSQGMMACIYLYFAAFSFSWGPLIFVYTSEIFPIRIRDYGMTLVSMNLWIMNFIVAKIIPSLIQNIGWKTWIMFGTFNIAAFLFALVIPETKGVALEETDALFGAVTTGEEGPQINVSSLEYGPREEETGTVRYPSERLKQRPDGPTGVDSDRGWC